MHDQCPFCAIAGGEQPAHVLSEDDHSVAFLDENPAVPGHTLVAPRTHEPELVTAEKTVTTAVFETVHDVSQALEQALEPDGFSVFHTSGPLVGTVDHAHVHLVPRAVDDDVTLSLARTELDPVEATALADEIRETL